MIDESRMLPRLPTGIPGFDSLIEGGLPVGGVFLVQGQPGAGKTILANQMCFHHARTGGQAVYLTLIAESHARMFNHLRRFEFFDPSEIGHRVHYHAGFRIMEEHGVGGLVDITRNAVVERNATLIVIDGLVNAGEMARSSTDFKLLLHAIQTISTNLGCTVVLLSSARESDANLPEDTVVDGIIQLTYVVRSLRGRRTVEIRKMRGVSPVMGQHSLEITEEGILVRPRLEARPESAATSSHSSLSDERLIFDIPMLDAMMNGGIPQGSHTIVVGPTGIGKTILGMQFVCAGMRQGERGIYFGFYERPDAVIAKSRRLGLQLHEGVENGLVDIIWERPVEGILDAVADRLLTRVRETGAKRLCLDGIHALKRMIDSPERIHAATAALSVALEQLGVTTVSTLETTELYGTPTELPIQDVSSVMQNMLLLRHVEQQGMTHRTVTVIKMRDSDFDPRVHLFKIASGGIQVGGMATGLRDLTRGAGQGGTKPRKAGR